MGRLRGVLFAKNLQALSADGKNGAGRNRHLFTRQEESAVGRTGIFQEKVFATMVDLGMCAAHRGVRRKLVRRFSASKRDLLLQDGIATPVGIQGNEFGHRAVQLRRKFTEVLSRTRSFRDRRFIHAKLEYLVPEADYIRLL